MYTTSDVSLTYDFRISYDRADTNCICTRCAEWDLKKQKQLKIHVICENRNVPSFFRRHPSRQAACHLQSCVGVNKLSGRKPSRFNEKSGSMSGFGTARTARILRCLYSSSAPGVWWTAILSSTEPRVCNQQQQQPAYDMGKVLAALILVYQVQL